MTREEPTEQLGHLAGEIGYRLGGRQVPDDAQVAVVGAGGGPIAGCMLLTRQQ
jgi:hypothetical protein